jgi:hypothetical protein
MKHSASEESGRRSRNISAWAQSNGKWLEGRDTLTHNPRSPPNAVVRETLARLGRSIPAKAERKPVAFDRFVRSEIARWASILTKIRTEK